MRPSTLALVDVFGGLLDGPRARGAFALRVIMDPPWSVRIKDRAPLSLVAVIKGQAWVIPENDAPAWLNPGSVAIIRGPEPYTFADDPATPTQVVIHPGQHCSAPDGEDLAQAMDLGVRSWGNNPAGSTSMLIGTYERHSEIGQQLLSVLPQLVVMPAHAWDSPLLPMLSDEIVKDEPGQEAVLDRLLDLLVVAVLRAWFARHQTEAPGWYRAQRDPVVGRALRMLQNNPEQPWTVATLAAEIGVSRAALARRFADVVGEPPMTFLTAWRLALAADLLREPDTTIAAVAQQVGYSSAFALSAAFKRVRGVTPKDHRAAVAR
jgi:AraC-like DNA-binding protein